MPSEDLWAPVIVLQVFWEFISAVLTWYLHTQEWCESLQWASTTFANVNFSVFSSSLFSTLPQKSKILSSPSGLHKACVVEEVLRNLAQASDLSQGHLLSHFSPGSSSLLFFFFLFTSSVQILMPERLLFHCVCLCVCVSKRIINLIHVTRTRSEIVFYFL